MKLAVFDIGGSAVKYGLWEDGTLSHQDKFTTPETYDEMKDRMTQVIASFGDGIEGAALSAPGAVNVAARRIDGISAVPYIHDIPIFDDLEQTLGVPVTIENDANCAGICEVEMGAGRDADNVVFLVIGTGVGGAVFINRKLYKGAHLFAGEFGLLKSSSSQTLSLTGTAVKAAAAYSREKDTTIDGKQLFALAESGDELAQKLLDNMYQQLANSLFNIQVSIDPELVIIGGGISARRDLADILKERLANLLEEQTIGSILPDIKTCEYANDANLLGAALNFETIHDA